MTTLYFLFCFIIPIDDVIIDIVDCIEVNHIYDENGSQSGTFINFWKNSSIKEWEYKSLVDWRNIPKDAYTDYTEKEMGQKREEYGAAGVSLPKNLKKWAGLNITYDHQSKKYTYIFWDGQTLRKIESTSFIRTWTMYDVEVEHRRFQDKDLRVGLFNFR